MKVALKAQSKTMNDGSTLTITEHPLEAESLNIATAQIAGRYPEQRRISNTACNEIAYVLAGLIINKQRLLMVHHLSSLTTPITLKCAKRFMKN